MKKIYLFLTLISLISLNLKASLSDPVQGGNMEDSTKWTVTQIDTVAGQTATVTFNYTADKPTAGSGGCMRVTATNAVASTGNNVIIWQKVSLKSGHHYLVDCAFKDIGGLLVQSYWCQWYVEKATPVTGSDFSAEARARGQINTWNTCLTDYANLDITLQTWECKQSILGDTVVVDKDTIYTFGVKTGVYNANVISYDVLIDNMSLLDIDSAGSSVAVQTPLANEVQIYPSPSDNVIYLTGADQFYEASILNVLGENVSTVTNFGRSIDVSSLKPGVYIIKFRDIHNNISVSKFQKR